MVADIFIALFLFFVVLPAVVVGVLLLAASVFGGREKRKGFLADLRAGVAAFRRGLKEPESGDAP